MALTASRVIDRKGTASTAVPLRITVYAKANAKGYQGGLVGVDATGYAVSGAALAATAIKIIGVSLRDWDATGLASGALSFDVERGIYPFANLGGDAITQAAFFSAVFAEDDATVRATNGAGTRSAAGLFIGFDEAGLPLVQVGNYSQTGV